MAEWWALPLAGVVGAALKWLADRRNTSGRVITSDAKTLWDQAEKLRRELEGKSVDCEREVQRLELEVFRLRIENHSLRNDLLKLQFDMHPEITEDLRNTLVNRNEAHITELQQTYADLQKRIEANS